MRRPRAERQPRSKGLTLRRRIATSAALVALSALAAAAILSATLAGQRVSAIRGRQDVTGARDAALPGDLRCLTRRADDCLAEPVPRDEPHGAVCATCHSLWERGDSVGSIRSCTDAACHARADTLTRFHRTVSRETLADCTSCHVTHSFRVRQRGQECFTCHEAGGQPAVQARTAPVRRLPRGLAFEHDEHAALECVACHAGPDAHGTVRVAALGDCRSCHHEASAGNDCVRCHTRSEMDALSFTVTRALDLRIGSLDRPERTLLFEHRRHETAACRTCHTGANLEAPASTDCSSCHFEHHEPTADCGACHERPAEGAHDMKSHLGCGGVSCHVRIPAGIAGAPRTRQLCLACHTEYADHELGRDCADCHVLPAPVMEGMDRM